MNKKSRILGPSSLTGLHFQLTDPGDRGRQGWIEFKSSDAYEAGFLTGIDKKGTYRYFNASGDLVLFAAEKNEKTEVKLVYESSETGTWTQTVSGITSTLDFEQFETGG